MLDKIIETALKNRLLVVLFVLGIVGFGFYSYKQLPTDAFPDISPIMVPIFAEAHGMAPEEIERLITFPIESAMNGLPDVRLVKSTSAFGMAVIYVYFEDKVDIYFARQIVSERLNNAIAELPALHEAPSLGPISTGLGEVFMYYLTGDDSVNTEGKELNVYLREINDWIVKYQLQTTPGVTEILSMGGHVLQYQVSLNPYALKKYGLGLEEVVEAINDNNKNAGGQFLVMGSEEYLVRGIGLIESIDDLRRIQIRVVNGTPIRIQDVAEVMFGKEIRRGVVILDGKSEIVSGIVMKLYGENTSAVIKRINEKIPEIQKSLPPGVRFIPYYDQSKLVNNALNTISSALWQGAVLVVLVLILFLGNIRSALIVTLSLPFCALVAFICMKIANLSANLMSLGGIAIAIGMLGDGSIVMVENIFRHLSTSKKQSSTKTELILSAAREVGSPIIFSIAIIIIVFLPLFSLQGVEGKMFSPLAYTITFALLGSIVTAILITPALSSLLLTTKETKEFFFIRWLKSIYSILLHIALKMRYGLVLCAIAFLGLCIWLIPKLGTEFIPVLQEGAIQINVTMAPSISLVEATNTVFKLQQALSSFDQIETTVAKIGRPEAGSHPHPVNTGHIQISLKPINTWKQYSSKTELINAINKHLSNYPGVQLNFSQPIQNMFDELLSGSKTQLAVKLFGDDISVLRSFAEKIQAAIKPVKGLVDCATEQSFGQPQIQIIADRSACSRYGVNAGKIIEMVELAIGGEIIDQIYVNNRRFGIYVRYMEQYRFDPAAIKNILIQSSEGYMIPLSQVATVKQIIGPIQINRENNQRCWTVSGNIRGRDMGGVVADIKKSIQTKINLPSGYHVEFGGQFENQQRAMKRLSIIVPCAIFLIFIMLYLSLGKFGYSLLILVNIPLALIGGIFGLFIMKEYLSVPASVGFIALFGIAVQNGLVLVTHIHQLYFDEGIPMKEAVIQGSLNRLRPVLMTAITTMCGLIPLLLAHGIGSEVQRPLATVVVFGLISSTFLTLFMIPSLFSFFAPRLVRDVTPVDESNNLK